MGRNIPGALVGNDSQGNAVYNTVQPAGFIRIEYQRGLSKYAAVGVVRQSTSLVTQAILAMEFGFGYQNTDGSFPLTATAANTATGLLEVTGAHSFWQQDLGHALLILQASTWFQTASECSSLRTRITALATGITNAANWLSDPASATSGGLSRSANLAQNDRKNPNRIFIQTAAHYQLGVYLNRSDLKALGQQLLRTGLKLQALDYTTATRTDVYLSSDNLPYAAYARTTTYLQSAPLGWGYFCESGGSDTSYNGVNLKVLISLINCVPSTAYIRAQLWNALKVGVAWQDSRVLSTGEISLVDNTRVTGTSGGEAFLGVIKTVDYIETVTALNFYGYLTNRNTEKSLAELVIRLYTMQLLALTAIPSLYSSFANNPGLINYSTATIKVALVQKSGTGNYPVNLATNQYFSSVPSSAIAATITLAGTYNSGTRYYSCATPTRFVAVPAYSTSTNSIGALVIYADTGDATTSPLIAYADSAIVSGLTYRPQGTDIQVDWAGLNIFQAPAPATPGGTWSLIKVNSGYSGPLVRIRRVSDNTEQDFSASGVRVDTAAIATFLGAGTGTVSKWYDQSGAGNHATQTDTTKQPQYVASGARTNIPALRFDGTGKYFNVASTVWSKTGSITFAALGNTTSTNGVQPLFYSGSKGDDGAGGSPPLYEAHFGYAYVSASSYRTDLLLQDDTSTANAVRSQQVITSGSFNRCTSTISPGGSSSLYMNGSSTVVRTASAPGITSNLITVGVIGVVGTLQANRSFAGDVESVVISTTVLTGSQVVSLHTTLNT